ncbi:hypothetical protein OIV83_002684 [Microbotryomycetes sp. JL201]|nr:hypothetical protein OIV83_002684 [Microbotryomycetes sp. JL201]
MEGMDLTRIEPLDTANGAPSTMTRRDAPPALLGFLVTSMSTFPGRHDYTVQVLRSQPRRSYALFPYASNHKQAKVWQEEVLVVLSEDVDVPASTDGTNDSTTGPSGRTGGGPVAEAANKPRRAAIPVVGLEANIYTIPSTSSSMIYVSKVDTTGLASPPFSPARTLVSSFLTYFLQYPPHLTTRLRIHVFAKSQPQYLFPGSVDNPGKKRLDDKGLTRWWKNCITAAAEAAMVTTSAASDRASMSRSTLEYAPKMFYLIPGLSYVDSLPYVPVPPPGAQAPQARQEDGQLPQSKPVWIYAHSYSHLPSLLHSPSHSLDQTPITDLIPAFPDDPKSRFIQSTTSSTLSAAGLDGDFDDVFLRLKSATITTGANGTAQARGLDEIEREREKEAKRFRECEGGIEGWWEMMAFRQECCSGALVAFFVVARGDEQVVEFENAQKDGKQSKDASSLDPARIVFSHQAPTKERMAIHHPAFVRLWSQFHNVDYSLKNLAKAANMAQKWAEDVERVTQNEDDEPERDGSLESCKTEDDKIAERKRLNEQGYNQFVRRRVEVRNEHAELELSTKRQAAAEAPKAVNVLAPRKKKPKNQ